MYPGSAGSSVDASKPNKKICLSRKQLQPLTTPATSRAPRGIPFRVPPPRCYPSRAGTEPTPATPVAPVAEPRRAVAGVPVGPATGRSASASRSLSPLRCALAPDGDARAACLSRGATSATCLSGAPSGGIALPCASGWSSAEHGRPTASSGTHGRIGQAARRRPGQQKARRTGRNPSVGARVQRRFSPLSCRRSMRLIGHGWQFGIL